MTHESIGLGEDGPTHQPIEHLASFRAMPHMCLIRPADANETAWAWRAAMLRKNGPTMLLLTRQKVPIFDRTGLGSAEGLLQGAYILSREQAEKPDVILIASGSEVQLILQAQPELEKQGIHARVVSMPSWELFDQQDDSYRNEVLPPDVTARLAVEAGACARLVQIRHGPWRHDHHRPLRRQRPGPGPLPALRLHRGERRKSGPSVGPEVNVKRLRWRGSSVWSTARRGRPGSGPRERHSPEWHRKESQSGQGSQTRRVAFGNPDWRSRHCRALPKRDQIAFGVPVAPTRKETGPARVNAVLQTDETSRSCLRRASLART